MTDRIKITDLETLEDIAGGDWVPVVDVDDTTDSDQGTTKKVRKDKLKGLNWQGAWSAGTYEVDDAVEHEGSAWVAIANTSEEPSDVASDWDLLAQKGDKGDQGDQGIPGMVWLGAWSAGAYNEDEVVENNGSAYIALTTTTEEPSDSATDWDLVAHKGDQGDKGNQWQGPWSAGTYQIDDVVEHNGSSWIAIAVTTQEPTNIASEWDLFAKAGEDGAGSGDMLKANYDPTNVNADAFAMDNMAEGADTKILTAAERTKLGHILVTQSVDLDQMEADIAALANGMVYKGNWDASAGTFPGAGAAQTGWFYTVSVAGTVDGVVFNIGDRLIAVVDNASATVYASNWTQLDATDAVTSVASLTGNISAAALLTALSLDDVIKESDTSTAGFGFVVDEDNMASDSPTKVPTQQSVKAYVDGKKPPQVDEFPSNGTWTKPSGAKQVRVQLWGGGGSGGSNSGDAGGGGGGAYIEGTFDADDLSATESVTVGVGGNSVTNGNTGNSGGDSSFGSKITAYGGGGGGQGASANNGVGGGGGSWEAKGPNGGATGKGTAPTNTFGVVGFFGVGNNADGTVALINGVYSGGGGSGYGNASFCQAGKSIWGGGGGAGTGTSSVAGTSKFGGNGGAENVAGSVPGGGGGGSEGGTSGAGANGYVIVTTFF